ncbi:ferredoxin-thioredoxin reductase variable chain, partial [Microcoleus sp. T2B6]|uniref:ferredoxin-thioredoxin reductase variable chain n=2 Tax=Microcoleus TaxID=44471 RepID=UPI004040A6B2
WRSEHYPEKEIEATIPHRRGNHTSPTPQGDSRRLKPPSRFPLRAEATEFPIYRMFLMKVGDRVCIKNSVVVYHHPENRSQPFDIKGMEGEVVAIVHEWHGRPVSANWPVLVQFDKKFRAHFKEDEVELISSEV